VPVQLNSTPHGICFYAMIHKGMFETDGSLRHGAIFELEFPFYPGKRHHYTPHLPVFWHGEMGR
jgi:hypothetical protein